MPFHHRCDFCLIIRFLISGGLAILMSVKRDIVYNWETTLGTACSKAVAVFTVDEQFCCNNAKGMVIPQPPLRNTKIAAVGWGRDFRTSSIPKG